MIRVAILSLVLTLGVACQRPAVTTPERAAEQPPHGSAGWSYQGPSGPDHWAGLEASFATCGTGRRQSPVDIAGATTRELDDLDWNTRRSTLRLSDNGHTVVAAASPGNFVGLDGAWFELQQLHFHAPSEHTLDGASSAVELHLVHQADGRLMVVGVLLTEGAENPAYAGLVDALASDLSETELDLDPLALLPDDRRTYRYSGSLTTPPCTEEVHWSVLAQPVELAAAQLERFTDRYLGNRRPVQALLDRSLELDASSD